MNRPKSRSGLIRAPRPTPVRLPTTATAAPAPVPRPASAGLGTIVKEGFAFGIGQSVAHTIVGRVLAPPSGPETQTTQIPTNKEYEQCMKEFNDEAGCKHLWQG